MSKLTDKFGDQLYDYCKYECPLRKRKECEGIRYSDTDVFEKMKRNPTLGKIVSDFHLLHPPCNYYWDMTNKKIDIDMEDIESGNYNPKRSKIHGSPVQIRKKKTSKPKPKRKIIKKSK